MKGEDSVPEEHTGAEFSCKHWLDQTHACEGARGRRGQEGGKRRTDRD